MSFIFLTAADTALFALFMVLVTLLLILFMEEFILLAAEVMYFLVSVLIVRSFAEAVLPALPQDLFTALVILEPALDTLVPIDFQELLVVLLVLFEAELVLLVILLHAPDTEVVTLPQILPVADLILFQPLDTALDTVSGLTADLILLQAPLTVLFAAPQAEEVKDFTLLQPLEIAEEMLSGLT